LANADVLPEPGDLQGILPGSSDAPVQMFVEQRGIEHAPPYARSVVDRRLRRAVVRRAARAEDDLAACRRV
jgi:hypothetical protein